MVEYVISDLGAVKLVWVDMLSSADTPRIEDESAERIRALVDVIDPLPPIVVRLSTMQVIDGTHRSRAARLRGDSESRAEDRTKEVAASVRDRASSWLSFAKSLERCSAAGEAV